MLWAVGPADAQEVAVVAVGTWTRNPLAADPPGGGVAVANAPDGALTVAAVRFSGSATGVTLRLRPSDPGVAPLGAAVQACVTTSPWQPVVNGDLAAAPAADCSAGAVSLTADAGGVWSGDISVLLERSPSILLLPAPGAPPLFLLSFGPPTVEQAAADTSSGAGASPTSPPAGPSGPAEPPPAEPAALPPSATAGSPPPAPFSARPSELAAPVPTPTVATAQPAAVDPVGVGVLPAGASASDGAGRDLGQALRLTLLALAIGFASMPFWRVRDGQYVPGLSPLLAVWRRRVTGADA